MSRSAIAAIAGAACAGMGLILGCLTFDMGSVAGMQKTGGLMLALLLIGIAVGYALGPKEKE
jgi:hypothetical protein